MESARDRKPHVNEMNAFTKEQAILAQANQLPEAVLELLR